MNGLIYKITNPAGHSYVGKTINWENRYRKYKNLDCKDQPALYNSFLKYGFENHKIEILANNIAEENLNYYEKLWILKEKTFEDPNHLNLTEGGDGVGSGKNNPNYGKKLSQSHKEAFTKNNKLPKSDEHKRKISESEKGKFVSDETRLKLKLSHLGQKAWNKGIPTSEETKKKQSLAKLGKPSPRKGKKFGPRRKNNV